MNKRKGNVDVSKAGTLIYQLSIYVLIRQPMLDVKSLIFLFICSFLRQNIVIFMIITDDLSCTILN